MKRIFTLIILTLTTFSIANAQLWTIATCSNLGSTTYGPMYSLATAGANNRTAVIYPAGQLTGLSGEVLTSMWFDRTSATGSMVGTPNFKIYLKEVTVLDFGAGAIDWATEITGATLLFDSDPASIVGSSAGWKEFPFTSTFTYGGTDNLAVFFEYSNATASSSISWAYEYTTPCIDNTNSNTTKYNNNTTGTLSASLASSNYRRPEIAFNYQVSCPQPSLAQTTGITATEAVLSWTETGSAPYWEVQGGPAGFALGSGLGDTTSSNTFPLSGLTPATDYEWYVRSFCAVGDTSAWTGPITFTTPCAPYVPFYLEDFTTWIGATTLPACWNEYNNEVLLDGTQTPNTASGWVQDGFANNAASPNSTTATRGSASIELYNLGDSDWLVSPDFDLTTGGPYQVDFNWLISQWSTYVDAQIGGDDYVELFISDDGGSSWTSLEVWDSSTVVFVSPMGEYASFDLTAYAGSTVQFAFLGSEAVADDPGDIKFFFDNFRVRKIPTCFQPMALNATNITATSVDLDWTTGGSTDWVIEYGIAGFAVGTGTDTLVNTNPFSLSGLMETTNYDFYVRDYCGPGDSSLWFGPINVTTSIAPVVCAPGTGSPSNLFQTSFETNPACGTGNTDWNSYLGWENTNTVTGSFGGASWRIECSGTSPSGWIDAQGFDGSAYAYMESSDAGVGTDPLEDTLTTTTWDVSALTGGAKFSFYYLNGGSSNLMLERSTDGGTTWTNIFTNVGAGGTATDDLGPWSAYSDDISGLIGTIPSVTYRFIGQATASNGGDIGLDLVTFEACVSCLPPSALAVEVIAADSALITFTPFGAGDSTFLEYGTTGFTQGAGTTISTANDSVYLIGLMAATGYDVYVLSSCVSTTGDSSTVVSSSFATPCAPFTAPYAQNFDAPSTSAGDFNNAGVLCWSAIGPGANDLDISTTVDFAGGIIPSLPNVVEFNDGAFPADTSMLVSPQFTDLPSGLNRIRFSTAFESAVPADVTLIVGVMTDPNNSATFIPLDTLDASDVGGEDQFGVVIVNLDNTSIIGAAEHIAFLHGPGVFEAYLDNFFYEAIPSCEQPSALGAGPIFGDSATLTWTANGVGTEYEIELDTAGFTPTGVPTTLGIMNPFYTATGLTSLTAYEYYVRTRCSLTDSSYWSGPFAFTTECGPYIPYYQEDFSTWTGTTSLPECWKEYNDEALLDGTQTPNTASSWLQDGFGNDGSSPYSVTATVGSASIELWNLGDSDWLVSPQFNLSTGGDYKMHFNWTLTRWNTLVFEQISDDDFVELFISDDGGLTYTSLEVWDATTVIVPSPLGEFAEYDLTAYTGSTVQFAFLGSEGVIDDASDVKFFMDNFTVELITTDDVGVAAITSPTNGCGEDFSIVTLEIENFGINDQTNVPVTVEVTGAVTATYNVTLASILAGTTETLVVDSFNTVAGGIVNITAYTSLVGDELASNDTMMTTAEFNALPVAPVFMGETICEGDSITRTSSTNVKVYEAGSSVVLANDTTFTLIPSTTTTYEYEAIGSVNEQVGATSVPTGGFASNAQYGIRFSTSTGFILNSFKAYPNGTGTIDVAILDDASEAVLYSITGIPVSDGGTPYTEITVPLGFVIPASVSDYRITITNSTGIAHLGREFGLTFPYSTSGGEVVMLGGSTGAPNGTSTSYYWFYDWDVTIEGCPSARESFTVTVNPTTYDTIPTTACDSFDLNGTNITMSGLYNDTLTGVLSGCDSVLVYDVTINLSTSSAVATTICSGDSTTLPDGVMVGAAGTYTSTITNGANCDSVVTTTVSVVNPTSSSQTLTLCFGESTTVGSNTYTMSGSYMDTLMNAVMCDSIVTTTLTIRPEVTGTYDISVCDGDTVFVGTSAYTMAGVYFDTLNNSFNCDSTITTTVTILPNATTNQTLVLCAGASTTVGSNVYTTTGVYTDVFVAANTCDSTVITNLTILAPITTSQNVQLCSGDSVTVGTNVYSTTGSYSDVLSSSSGCDSIVTTNLVVSSLIDITIGGVSNVCANVSPITLSLDPVGGTLSGPGVTGTSFDPDLAGLGAHILTYTFVDANGCNAMASLNVDVIVCTDITDLEGIEAISIYPNPFASKINVQFEDTKSSDLTITLFDVQGKVIVMETVGSNIGMNNFSLELPSDISTGVHMLQIERDGAVYNTTLVKE